MAKLPSNYQEVEYIQSSGTQYLIIGNTFKTSYKTVIDLQMDVIGADYVPVGLRNSSNYRYGVDAWSGYFQIISGGNDWKKTLVEDKNRHTITIDKSTATIDGTNYSIYYTNATFSHGIGVFCYNNGTTPESRLFSSNKLYKLDIYNENGVKIYDLYPAYRKSDNVIGLYDLINDVFYTNIGSGTFTKGPNVEYPPEYKLHGHIGTWHMESIKDYSAMQGPAPSGFHVPLYTEWQSVKDIWTALGGGGSDGTNFGIALKLPFAGLRLYSNSNVNNQGSNGHYWASTRYDGLYAYSLRFYSSDVRPQNLGYRANGYSVRCFKNVPTIPTSTWTKLYGTSIESGGIFWSSADGLISLSSDGQTWVTIADKNLGATTVWNSGDTLNQANCGKYYQWGNNYGFDRNSVDPIATSSTQVDASNYGPGNYYSSSTFIKYGGRWDSTDNGNLWGGETGVVTHYIPRS